MSTTPTIVVPAAKDAPPTPIPSVESKIAAAFNTPPPPPMPKAPTPPANPATNLPKTPEPVVAKALEAPPKVETPKVIPTLLPKKTPAPPPAPDDPDAKFVLPDTAPEEARSQWTELKRISRERFNRIKELEAKVATPIVSAEVERLRAEHKAATDRLAILDLQSHPDFKRQFHEPKSKALAEAQEILAFSGQDEIDLPSLLSMDRKAFSARVTELTKDLAAMDATTVQSAMRSAYTLAQGERSALSKAGELSSKMAQQSEVQARQAFEEVSANLGPLGDFLVTLDVPEGATAEEKIEIEDYNQSVTGIRSNVERTVFGKANEKSMAVLGWKGATLDFLLAKGIPRMEKNYMALVQSHAALAAELQAIKGSKGSGPISGDPTKGGAKPATIEEQVAAAYGRK